MNIPIIRTNKIFGNDNKLEIEANIEVKGSIRASSLMVNDQPLGDIINNTAKTAAVNNKLYTWIKYSEFYDGAHMSDKPTINSNYIGFAYNQLNEIKGTNPKQYTWTLITGKNALQYYTWMKYATGPSGEGINDIPLDDTYIYLGLAYNKLTQSESNIPSAYVWTKFIGPQGVQGPNGYTWIKYATDSIGTGLTDNPVGMDYIGMSYNKLTATESDNPDDYKPWLLYKGSDGLPGPVGAPGVSIIMSASNFTFTADFDGSIASSAYSQATSSITVLDGVNIVMYSHLLNNAYNSNVMYNTNGNNLVLYDDGSGDDYTLNQIYSILDEGEWVLYSIVKNGILLSNTEAGIIPSTGRDYATLVAPTNMINDTASLQYTIVGKTYAGATFSFKQGQTFSKASVGPGIVYRGQFATGATYYASTKRRDVVYNPSSTNYWTASNLDKNGLKTWLTPSSGNSDWSVFAAEFSSIATGVIISEESYVKNTLNIGTNASGSAGNITLYGGNQYPFISLGQSTIGYGNPGFWLGATGSGSSNYLMSIGDNSNYLKWTGSGLQIKGAIEITSSNSIASKNDLSGATAAANSYANTVATNAANNITVGGRNLIPNSFYNIDFNEYGGHGRIVALTQNKEYTFSANGNNANAQNGKVLWVILYKSDWTFQQNLTIDTAIDSTKSSTFTAPYTGNFFIDCYYADNSSPRTGSVHFNWCKLELGNKATDWTPAPEDVDAAVLTAQTTANSANALLADIASDSKLTPNEKIIALKEWNTIFSEKPLITEQANNAGLFPSVNYEGYNDRDHYEFYYTGLYSYITPLLAGMTSTSDIVSATFRAAFSNYYIARTSMLSAISNSLSNSALNLLSNSSQFIGLPNWNSNGSNLSIDTVVKYNGFNTFKITGYGGAYNTADVRLDPSSTYTYSAFVRSNENYTGSDESLLHLQNWTDENKTNVRQETVIEHNQSLIGNTWKLIYVTFTTPASITQIHSRFYFYPLTSTMILNVYYVKLEKGKRPTPISISGDSAVSLIPIDTTGKLVLEPAPTGSGLYLGDSHLGFHDGNIWKTYMSNTGNFMLAGATATSNSLSWDGTSLNITGKIQATDGTVGGWNVGSNSLNSTDNSIIFHGTENYIKLFDDDGNMRFWANGATGALPSLSGNSMLTYFNSTNISQTTTNSNNNISNHNQYVTTGIGATTAANSASYTIRYNKVGGSLSNAMASACGGANAMIQMVMELYENGNYLKSSNSYYAGTYGGAEWKSDVGGGGGGGTLLPASVTADTEIQMFDGTIKLAKDIKKEDKIKAWDWVNNKNEFIEAEVDDVRHRTVSGIIKVTTNSKVVYVSDTHGFWTDNNEEIKVLNLIQDVDKIYVVNNTTGNLELEVVQKIEIINSAIEVYTLSINSVNNYISNGILSHNMPSQSGGGSSAGWIFTTKYSYFPINWQMSISANFVQGHSYEVKLRCTYTIQSTDTSTYPVYFPDDSNSSFGSVYLYVPGIADSVQFIPSNTGLIVNGAGIRATSDSNNYLEVTNGTNANALSYSTKIAGNAQFVDGAISPTSSTVGYPSAVKAWGNTQGAAFNCGWGNGWHDTNQITITLSTGHTFNNATSYFVIATCTSGNNDAGFAAVQQLNGSSFIIRTYRYNGAVSPYDVSWVVFAI